MYGSLCDVIIADRVDDVLFLFKKKCKKKLKKSLCPLGAPCDCVLYSFLFCLSHEHAQGMQAHVSDVVHSPLSGFASFL